jgi:DNA mismatch repair protein MutS
MKDISKLTPAQRQYVELKNKYNDSILFFRMWDFYETFYDDAKICNKVLEIALTSRDRSSDDPIPMAWVPYHSVEKYIHRLVQSWYKVSIAEQIWEVKPWQIVKRDVVSVITPGTFIDEKNSKNYNFIWALCFKDEYYFSWWDFSIWEYYTKDFKKLDDIFKFITKLDLKEFIMDIDLPWKDHISNYLKTNSNVFLSIYDLPFDIDVLLKQILWVQTLSSFGQALEWNKKYSIWLLFNYLKDTQKTSLKNVSRISYYGDENKVNFDDITIKNLEILKSSYESNKKYSLLWVIDNTNCPMWARLLSDIIINPIKDINDINKRLSWIEYFYEKQDQSKYIIDMIRWVWDIPRTITTLIYKKNNIYVFNRLKFSLRNVLNIYNWTDELLRIWLDKDVLYKVKDYYIELEKALKDEWFTEELDYINDWYDSDIDELRKIAYHSDDLLLQYQQELISMIWLNNIKIKYIANQWYFIEVTKKDSEDLEKKSKEEDEKFDFMRRQTLKSQERYVTTYLEQIQNKILSARSQLEKLEKNILDNLKIRLENLHSEFYEFSDKIAWLDVFSSFWKFVKDKNWIKPSIKSWYELKIVWWRHPVIEEFLSIDDKFISNDLSMDHDDMLHIITWPNMWWKSTFLRQNALIVLLWLCWLWVPCESAEIGILDGIYARVWSWDIIAKNQSTFMTEMIEVSNILHNSTKNSFIILDELWRWTSTYDWVALAKAIVEYICIKIWAKTLFATHYHELISLEDKIKWLKNYSVSVYETDKQVIFMKKIIKWWVNKSYWIDVAKLAWIPNDILENSKKYLRYLEQNNSNKNNINTIPLFDINQEKDQRIDKYEQFKKYIDNVDINNITPLNALEILNKLKNM